MQSSQSINSAPKNSLESKEVIEDDATLWLQGEVEVLQNKYITIWKDCEKEIKEASIFCHHLQEKNIQQILDKFNQYKNVNDIARDFRLLRALWIDSAKKKKFDKRPANAYLLILSSMEAVLINAFVAKLRCSIQLVDIKQYLPTETLIEVDIKKIVPEIITDYEKSLPTIFDKHTKTFKHDIKPALKAFDQEKKSFQENCKKFFDMKPIEENKNVSDIEQCNLMIAEEVRNSGFLTEYQALLAKRGSLVFKGTEALEKAKRDIDKYIISSMGEVTYPKVDVGGIPALLSLSEQIQQQQQALTSSIELIKKQNEVRSSYIQAKNTLYQFVYKGDGHEYKIGWKDRVQKNIEKQNGKWFFKDDQAQETCDYLKDKLSDIEQAIKGASEVTLINYTLLVGRKTALEQKLSGCLAELQGLVKREAMVLLEKIAKDKRANLVSELSTFCEVPPVLDMSFLLNARKKHLDDFWSSVIITEKNFSELERLKNEFLEKSQRNHDEESIILKNRADILTQKLEDYQLRNRTEKPVPSLEDSKRETLSLTVVKPEEKSAAIVQERKAETVSSAAESEEEPVIRPWIRAAVVGLACGLFVALVCTGVGIIAAASVTTIILLASFGGLAGFAFGAGEDYVKQKANTEPTIGPDDGSSDIELEPIQLSSTAALPFKPVLSRQDEVSVSDYKEEDMSKENVFPSPQPDNGKNLRPY